MCANTCDSDSKTNCLEIKLDNVPWSVPNSFSGPFPWLKTGEVGNIRAGILNISFTGGRDFRNHFRCQGWLCRSGN